MEEMRRGGRGSGAISGSPMCECMLALPDCMVESRYVWYWSVTILLATYSAMWVPMRKTMTNLQAEIAGQEQRHSSWDPVPGGWI